MYSIDDNNGEQITTGLQDHEVWTVAQRIADERGEGVWVYQGTEEPTEVRPAAPPTRYHCVDETYDHDATSVYESVDDFYAVVRAGLGCAAATLYEAHDGSGSYRRWEAPAHMLVDPMTGDFRDPSEPERRAAIQRGEGNWVTVLVPVQ